MKKLIKLSLLALFLGIHPVSCDRYDDDCGSPGNNAYFISGIDVETKDISSNHLVFSAPNTNSNTFYPIDSIGFLMNFETVDLAYEETPSFHGFQNMAIACSYLISYNNPIENIEAIYTGLDVRFNDSIHLSSGDTITKMFNSSYSYYSYSDPEPLEKLTKKPLEVYGNVLITFKVMNSDSLDFPFQLITTLTDGKIFTMQNLSVKLLPSK